MKATHDRALLFGILGAPLVWAAQLTVQYMLSAYACAHPLQWLIHTVTLVAVAIALTGLLVARRAHGRLHAIDPEADVDDTTVHRSRALAYAGMLSSGFFLIVTLAQGLPPLLLDPCR